MRNLKSYNKAAIDFFDIVVASKNITKDDPEYKNRLIGLRHGIANAYSAYNNLFAAKTLALCKAAGYIDQDKTDLLKLYHFPKKALQQLKVELTTGEANTLVNTCQNCTINEINSFDHLLPKDEFPEFAVNPKNLFPSCTQCNGYKSMIWREDEKMMFLNLYLDDLPNHRYLYTNFNFDDGISVSFEVRNDTGQITPGLYELIFSHYNRLHLPSRFAKNCDDVVTELINLIKSVQGVLDKDTIIEVVSAKAERDIMVFGHNHWKSLLTLDLMANDDFHTYLHL